MKLTRISPGLKLVRPGPAGTFSTGISRRPFGPCTVTMAPAATMAGTLSPAGEPLQRLPPADARPCTCLEPIRLMASSTPGQTLPKRGWSCQHHAGDGGADPEAAIGGFLDRRHLGDFLDVDDHARLHDAGAHLHQKIGSAGQDARRASGRGKCANRFIKRMCGAKYRRSVMVVPSSPFSARPIWTAALSPARSCGSLHGQNRVGTASGVRFWRQAPMQEAGLRRVSPG